MKNTNYTPNLSDKRVIKRVVKTLQFVSACMSDWKPRQFSFATIERNFGQNDLGTWLRAKLLRVTNKSYVVDQGICKEYVFSRKGFDELVNEIRKVNPDAIKFFGVKAEPKKTDASMLTMNNETMVSKINQPNHPFCSLLLSDEQKLALSYTLEQCGSQLASGEFNLRESSCGRLHTEIQNVTSLSRTLASHLHGYNFEYDVETCYLTLVFQYAQQMGMTDACPAIENYLENKTARREYLAKLMKGNIDDAKDLLTSIFNGAPFGPNPRWSSFRAVSCRGFIMQSLKEDKWLTQLREEIRVMWKTIELTEPVVYKDGKNGKQRKQVFNSKRKAAVYFKLERKMLDAVMAHLTKNDNTFFPIHDGWVCKKKVDEKALIANVFAATGFKIKLSIDELSTKIKELEMNNTPKNWKSRPRYAKILKQLNSVPAKYAKEAEFAKESLENWVNGIPSFFEQVSPPMETSLTLEQMEDWLRGKNTNHRGESQYYGDFFADCVTEYEDEFGDEGPMIAMFEDQVMNDERE